MKKHVIFANHKPGLEIVKYFLHRQDIDLINRVFIDENTPYANQIKHLCTCNNIKVDDYKLLNEKKTIDEIKMESIDFFITVYWPYLLKKEIIDLCQNTVNFHPALLPINRGWFPHVHSIIDGSPLGVTLHKIDENADTGPIWAQKRIFLNEIDTAKTIYDKLQEEIVTLFIEIWPKIRLEEVKPTPQKDGGNYHKKKEIEGIDCIDLQKTYVAKDFINLLRARSFGDNGYAYYIVNSEKIYINIRLSNSTKFI